MLFLFSGDVRWRWVTLDESSEISKPGFPSLPSQRFRTHVFCWLTLSLGKILPTNLPSLVVCWVLAFGTLVVELFKGLGSKYRSMSIRHHWESGGLSYLLFKISKLTLPEIVVQTILLPFKFNSKHPEKWWLEDEKDSFQRCLLFRVHVENFACVWGIIFWENGWRWNWTKSLVLGWR